MDTILNDTTIDKAIADDQVDGTSTDGPDNALSKTAAIDAAIAALKADAEEVAALAIATLDPKDMLKKYAKLGERALKHAVKAKASLKAGAWNGDEDLKGVCAELERIVRMKAPIKEVRMMLYIRIAVWLDCVEPVVPDVRKLSYHQVANKFVQTLRFDSSELTGEIKKDWLTWVRTTVERQLSDTPLTMKELDASVKEREEEIVRERTARSKRTPEQALEAEQKAADAKRRKARESVQTKVSNAVSEAIEADGLDIDVNDIVAVVRQAVDAMPDTVQRRGIAVLDVNAISHDECKQLAAVMAAGGKITEMKFLRDNLDRLIKGFENAMITSKAI